MSIHTSNNHNETMHPVIETDLKKINSQNHGNEAQKYSYQNNSSHYNNYEFYPKTNYETEGIPNETMTYKYEQVDDIEILVDPTLRKDEIHGPPPRPWFLYIMTFAQIVGLIWSLILNNQMTGSAIQTNPFNYLIGASANTLILMGARTVPCMKSVTNLTDKIYICPPGIQPDYSYAGGGYCTVANVCGMGGFKSGQPDQWWRFILPLFLHGGILHLLFNLGFQIRTGFQMESDIGWWRMAMIYFTSGIASIIFSGIFNGASFSPTTGSSGALYGIVACVVIDLVKNWKIMRNPWKEFAILMVQVVILLFIGTLPYIDNFAHVGGFLTGILAGFIFLPSLTFGKWDGRLKSIIFLLAIPLMIGWFILLIKGFYDWNVAQECQWCKYINCIPGMPWCEDKWQTTIQSASQ